MSRSHRCAPGVKPENCKWCLAGVPVRAKPAAVPAAPRPADATCRFRGEDPLPAGVVAGAGFNPLRADAHFACGHPTLGKSLPVVTTCRSCGSGPKAPACGPACSGYQVAPAEGALGAEPPILKGERPHPPGAAGAEPPPYDYADPDLPAPRSDRVVATVAVGPAGRDMLAVTEPLLRAYAGRVGADFVALTGDAPRAPGYPLGDKFRLHQLTELWARCLFVDADVVVRRSAPDLFRLVPEGSVGIHDDRPLVDDPGYLFHVLRQTGSPDPTRVLNSGVVVWDRGTPDVWRPPAGAFLVDPATGKPHHVAEQCVVQWNIERNNYEIKLLEEKYNYQWWADRTWARAAAVDPQFVHLAGVSQVNLVQPWATDAHGWRSALLRLLTAMEERT